MKLTIKEMVLFGMLGGLMFASKLVMELLPNVHLLGAFIVAITVVYRSKALYPIYVFVILLGLYYGFPLWWYAYLYVWTVLWGMVMLLPKNISAKISPVLYAVVSSIHGFAFGALCAPAQALLFGYSFEATLTWIALGFGFDCIHGISNLICGVMITPLIKALKKANTI